MPNIAIKNCIFIKIDAISMKFVFLSIIVIKGDFLYESDFANEFTSKY